MQSPRPTNFCSGDDGRTSVRAVPWSHVDFEIDLPSSYVDLKDHVGRGKRPEPLSGNPKPQTQNLDPETLTNQDPESLTQQDPETLTNLDPKILTNLDPENLTNLDPVALTIE